MKSSLLDKILHRPGGAFLQEACRKGLTRQLARTLEPAARELFPEEPASILESRPRFEEAALRTVMGAAGNLEISFALADLVAEAVESLGLASTSDVQSPFRRVWVQQDASDRVRGVVLTCGESEISVLIPSAGEPIAGIGGILHFSYRGFDSPVGYELQLNDSVGLPEAHVLHLTRVGGDGAIGRSSKRHLVTIDALVRESAASDQVTGMKRCTIQDISLGGVRLLCERGFERGAPLHLDVFLDDGGSEPFSVDCTVRWTKKYPDGHGAGLQFGELLKSHSVRLEKLIQELELASDFD